MANAPTIVVTFPPNRRDRVTISDATGDAANVIYLSDLADSDRAGALSAATVLLARHTGRDLHPGEEALLDAVRLIQFVTAGVDYIPLSALPPHVPIAANAGAYAGSMSEHALAMILAATKRLFIEHAALKRGEFNQRKTNRRLNGMTCGILGLGGIGTATARLARAVGMRVHAVNRSGRTTEPVDWIGAVVDLDHLVATSDALVIATPLNSITNGMIDARALGLMKPDSILVNLARGEIIDEAALYAHLCAHPEFTACLDAWWIEPVRHGFFRVDQPFLDLPNVIASPHNSAASPDAADVGLRSAIANVRCMLDGGTPNGLIGPDERAFTLAPV